MLALSKILSTGAWKDVVKLINDNFAKIIMQFESASQQTSVKLPLLTSVEEAKKSIPSPYLGQLVLIGATVPAPVYKWDGSKWADTGGKGGDAKIDLNQYLSKDDFNKRLQYVKPGKDVKL